MKRGIDKKNSEMPAVGALVANALDYLQVAISDFETKPKHSVVAFYTAVELFLKARLMHEHWSLLVTKDADLNKFKVGDFVSVGFDEACTRLKKVVGSPLPDHALQAFDVVRKHRNKMVHFFHEGEADSAVLQQIALEQLTAWHALSTLIRVQWAKAFTLAQADFEKIDRSLSKHRLYLQAKFDALKDFLAEQKKAGKTIVACEACSFEAAESEKLASEVYRNRCHVCKREQISLIVPCPNCQGAMHIEGDDGATCHHCDSAFTVGDLVSELNEEDVSYDNYFDARTPANCAFCGGYHTVVERKGIFVCMACVEWVDEVSFCGWCNEGNNGDLEMSGIKGCSHCDGNTKLLAE